MPIASSHKVWIPVGATGIVVGWENHGRRASVELDAPRTVVSVPWPWVETLPPRPAGPAPAGTAGPAAGPTA
jgi:hypothetical protein